MDVFKFQEMYKTNESRKQAISKMSEKEVKEIISSCGTPQGKAHIKKLWAETHKK